MMEWAYIYKVFGTKLRKTGTSIEHSQSYFTRSEASSTFPSHSLFHVLKWILVYMHTSLSFCTDIYWNIFLAKIKCILENNKCYSSLFCTSVLTASFLLRQLSFSFKTLLCLKHTCTITPITSQLLTLMPVFIQRKEIHHIHLYTLGTSHIVGT